MNTMKPAGLIKLIVIAAVVLFWTGSCIFSPKKDSDEKPIDSGVFQEPTKARTVIDNLRVSFSHLEPDWYEQCLHENYYYEVPSKTDELDIRWSRSDEMRIIRKMFADCTAFVFTANEISSYKEWGISVPDIPDGAEVVTDHPDEVWYVFNYTIDMDIFTKTFGDFKVHQVMQFKMVLDSETGYYSIIRWIDITPE